MLPTHLFLVRHGRSDGNEALARDRAGDSSMLNDPRFQERHGSTWRLVPKGIQQAVAAGDVLRPLLAQCHTLHCYVSPYVRAMETAAHLNIPNAGWKVTERLRERDWGELERLSEEEKRGAYAACLAQRKIQPFYWRPTGGESLADVCDRFNDVLGTVHRDVRNNTEPSGGVFVCHGEMMWSARKDLERMTAARFLELEHSPDPRDRIYNGHIFHYTRQNPEQYEEVLPHLGWFRSVVPTLHGMKQWTPWTAIEYKRYDNEDLLMMVSKHPSLVSLLCGDA